MKTEIRTTESGALELRVIVNGTCVLVLEPGACAVNMESMNAIIEDINTKINQ
jgi:hypothetical protein